MQDSLEKAAQAMRGGGKTFNPQMTGDVREARLARYARALTAA